MAKGQPSALRITTQRGGRFRGRERKGKRKRSIKAVLADVNIIEA